MKENVHSSYLEGSVFGSSYWLDWVENTEINYSFRFYGTLTNLVYLSSHNYESH